jgi:beta-glucanase (GH16 family)
MKWLVLAVLVLWGARAYGAEWELVWSDEFDKAGAPDATKWGYEEGLVRNREAQYYTRGRLENARVEKGVLIIEARKEKFANARYKPDGGGESGREFAEYTSASLVTRGKASWTYGRVEVRAKVPSGRGVWPAIWMLGTNIGAAGWPRCGEIDIMEYVGFDENTIHGTVHTGKYNHVKGTAKGAKLAVTKPYEDFHVYAMEWDAKKIDVFVDGKKYFTFENEGTGVEAWPFDAPQYLILNLAIGGSWGGQKGIDEGIFPQRLEVDYVRVYKQKAEVGK